jgi:hypothetical protein
LRIGLRGVFAAIATFDRHKQLVTRLLERTRRGLVEWKEGVAGGFQVSFSNNTIALQEPRHMPSGTVYGVLLINAAGEIADSFDNHDLDANEFDSAYYNMLKELYGLAQRHARGADKVLNELLSDLDGDDVPL